MTFKNLILIPCLVATSLAQAADKEISYAQPKTTALTKLAGTPKGGTNYRALTGNPKYLNSILASDTNSRDVMRFVDMVLMDEDPDTREPLPALALSVTISADKKRYTFKLNPEATWSDGSPFTADDVVFSIDTIQNPKTDAASLRVYYEGVQAKALDKHTVQFTIPVPKFNTLESINGIPIISKKQFGQELDFNKSKGIMEPLSIGPYTVKAFQRDQAVILERRKDWWGYKYPHYKNVYNADVIHFRVIPDFNVQYEKFLVRDIDVLNLRAEQMGLKVHGIDKAKFEFNPDVKTTKNRAFAIENSGSRPWTYVGWNLRAPAFQSTKTRKALAHLVNYKQMIDKVFFNYYIQATSPFGSMTPNSDSELRKPGKMITYDRKRALQMLREEGWSDSNGDNILDRMIDGKRVDFRFTLKTNSNNSMRVKLAQVLKEDFKAAGIDVTVQAMEWNAMLEDVDERRFDAILMGWGGTLSPDPKQIWHSESQKNEGSNTVGYANPKVDELIAKANLEFDLQKRALILQELNRIIYDEQPYVFLAEEKASLLGVTPKVSAKQWGFKFFPGTYMRDEYYAYVGQ